MIHDFQVNYVIYSLWQLWELGLLDIVLIFYRWWTKALRQNGQNDLPNLLCFSNLFLIGHMWKKEMNLTQSCCFRFAWPNLASSSQLLTQVRAGPSLPWLPLLLLPTVLASPWEVRTGLHAASIMSVPAGAPAAPLSQLYLTSFIMTLAPPAAAQRGQVTAWKSRKFYKVG